MPYLNGTIHHNPDGDDEIVSKFLCEQGKDTSVETRNQLSQAVEAEMRGDLDQAEADYHKILESVDHSQVIAERLESIQRRKENG